MIVEFILLNTRTQLGEEVFVVGNAACIGGWKVSSEGRHEPGGNHLATALGVQTAAQMICNC